MTLMGTGLFLRFDDEDERPTRQQVKAAPRAFSFSEDNPLTGLAYARSRFRDLPEYAARVVTDRLHLNGGEWNVLVEDGEVYDFVAPLTRFDTKTSATLPDLTGPGHALEFHARKSAHPGYTREQYACDVDNQAGRRFAVVDINDDAAWF
ncbi:hypothetical protein JOF53_004591 [Crossiella equi]|uniref:Uncharacterized protein n=1 Tax=Crossiella equi TaxID=130796 RepID=A0ABS5AHL4_9PSEU|nr:hypothetical protein [Crossiella equi]MBP2475719.1 hypothetical protein [Crossiella equi]